MTPKRWLAALLRRTRLGADLLALRALGRSSHLRSAGWFETFRHAMPVDADGRPIPWITYGAIRFLDGRVDRGLRVFEYGSGNSTLWWSERVAAVTSCEHDAAWFEAMRERLPASVTYLHVDLSDGARYAAQSALQGGRRYDVIVIDGRRRVDCAKAAPDALTERGVVVWDNTDRAEYREGCEFLAAQGFRRVDFWGMGPINTYESCTSVFYRPGNCLGI